MLEIFNKIYGTKVLMKCAYKTSQFDDSTTSTTIVVPLSYIGIFVQIVYDTTFYTKDFKKRKRKSSPL